MKVCENSLFLPNVFSSVATVATLWSTELASAK